MSSLHMVGPRRAVFELQAQQNDCALLMNQINRDEMARKTIKIVGIVFATIIISVIFVNSVRSAVRSEERRMDAEIQSWRAQGFPVPK